MVKDLVNVTEKISIQLIAYITLNAFVVICYSVALLFKGKKGPIYFFLQLEKLTPILLLIMLVIFLFTRNEFTTAVCLCDFKNDYFQLHDVMSQVLPHHLQGKKSDYICEVHT